MAKYEVTFVNPYATKTTIKKEVVEADSLVAKSGQLVVFYANPYEAVAAFNNVLCVKKVEE